MFATFFQTVQKKKKKNGVWGWMGGCVQREKENKYGKQYLENLDRKGYRKSFVLFLQPLWKFEKYLKILKFKDQE